MQGQNSTTPPNPPLGNEAVTKSDNIAWSMIVLLGMLAAFAPICTDIYLPAVPTITREFNSDAVTMQLSLTSSFFGLALGQLLIGPLSDAYGRKRPLYASLIVFVLASIGCALATDATELIIARLFQGISGAGGVVLSRTIACDLYSGSSLTRFMGLLMTINSLAPICGPVLGSAIISFFDWPMMFFFLALWGAILFMGSRTKLPETLPVAERSPHLKSAIVDMVKQLGNKAFLCLVLSMSFIMGGFFGYLASSPFIYQVIFSLSPVEYSMLFAGNAIFITIAANIAGKVSRTIADVSIIKISLVIQALATILLAVLVIFNIESFIGVVIALGFYVAMVGSSQTAGFGVVMSARSGGAGSASGIFGVMTFIFGAVSSPLVGLMGEHSMVPQLLCMAVCTVMSFVCLQVGLKHRRFNPSHEYHGPAAADTAAPAAPATADSAPVAAATESDAPAAEPDADSVTSVTEAAAADSAPAAAPSK